MTPPKGCQRSCCEGHTGRTAWKGQRCMLWNPYFFDTNVLFIGSRQYFRSLHITHNRTYEINPKCARSHPYYANRLRNVQLRWYSRNEASSVMCLDYHIICFTFAPDLKINALTMLRQIMSISMISVSIVFTSCEMSRCAHSISCFFRRMPSDSSGSDCFSRACM